MNALLAKLAFRKFLGLSITDHELTLSRVALTALGPVEIDFKRNRMLQTSSANTPAAVEPYAWPSKVVPDAGGHRNPLAKDLLLDVPGAVERAGNDTRGPPA